MGQRCDLRMTRPRLVGVCFGVLLAVAAVMALLSYLTVRRFKTMLMQAKVEQTRSRQHVFNHFKHSLPYTQLQWPGFVIGNSWQEIIGQLKQTRSCDSSTKSEGGTGSSGNKHARITFLCFLCVDIVIADLITLMSFRLVFGEGPGRALRTRWITPPSPARMNYYT